MRRVAILMLPALLTACGPGNKQGTGTIVGAVAGGAAGAAIGGPRNRGAGLAIGAVVGGILGNQIGKGHGSRKVLTVLGAAGGAFAGRAIEKQARGTTHWEIDVRRDDGQQQTVRSDVAPPYQPGERVRVVDGRLERV